MKNQIGGPFNTYNLQQHAIFYKILSLKLKELEFFKNFSFFQVNFAYPQNWRGNFYSTTAFTLSRVQP